MCFNNHSVDQASQLTVYNTDVEETCATCVHKSWLFINHEVTACRAHEPDALWRSQHISVQVEGQICDYYIFFEGCDISGSLTDNL